MTGNNEKQAEREAFEGAVRAITDPTRIDEVLMRDGGEHYEQWPTAMAWEVWQARAALAQQPQGEADLHAAIMNLRCTEPAEYQDAAVRIAYRVGHRDARHAAAERAATPPQAAPIYDKSVVKRLATQMGLIPEQAAPVAQGLTDEQIEAIWQTTPTDGIHYIYGEPAKELRIRFARAAILAQAAPSASAQQAEPLRSVNSDGMLVGPDVGAGTKEPVDLGGRICEHCGEGNAVLTFENGRFASNCDDCAADCDYFLVERLNQLIAVPAPSASPADQIEDAEPTA